MEREIYKGRGYRLHATKTSGKIVAMKVYQGNRAREVSFTKINSIYQHILSDYFLKRCSEAARFNQRTMYAGNLYLDDLALTIRLPVTQISLK